ncbi:MAG: alpha/beta hydrolase [Planctomycetota bacterium]
MLAGRRGCLILILFFGLVAPSALPAQENPPSEAESAFENASAKLDAFNRKHSRVFDGGRVPIHYLDWENKGVPLILLHGTYSTAHDFVRFAPQLIKAGYRPISVDWYGHGQTAIPKPPVSASDFGDDLRKLLDSLSIKKAVIAGHSRGGALATAFYKTYPNRVLGVALIDGGSTCVADYFASLGESHLRDWIKSGFDEKTGRPLAPTHESLKELFAATWERFGRPSDPTEMFDVLSQSSQNANGRWTRWRQPLKEWLGQDTFENTFHGMLNPKGGAPFFASTVLLEPIDAYENLTVPVLILDAIGSNDGYRDVTPTEHNKQMQRLHPDLVELVEVRAGHFIHREKPDFFVSKLSLFKERVIDHAKEN